INYVDPNFSCRDWNLATAMVIKGDALLQVMGDWAKGEFFAAKKTPDTDFLCYRFPGTDGSRHVLPGKTFLRKILLQD
ncbi:hypothetical protein ACC724_40010, partial [Rhizobium ruizarguesonis]